MAWRRLTSALTEGNPNLIDILLVVGLITTVDTHRVDDLAGNLCERGRIELNPELQRRTSSCSSTSETQSLGRARISAQLDGSGDHGYFGGATFLVRPASSGTYRVSKIDGCIVFVHWLWWTLTSEYAQFLLLPGL